MLICCISSKLIRLLATPIFTCSTLNTEMAFKNFTTKTGMWICTALFIPVFEFATVVLTTAVFLAKHENTHAALHIISYEAVVTLHLPHHLNVVREIYHERCRANLLPSLGAHILHVVRIFLWYAHPTSPKHSLKLSDCLLAIKMRLICHSCNLNKTLRTENIKQHRKC